MEITRQHRLMEGSEQMMRPAQLGNTERGWYILLRYSVALLLFIYGFAKLNGAQFTILDSELDKPMGDVSGFWLTWYYFGFSPVFGSVVALAQIGGAVLLLFRKTVLAGASLLVPVVVNIVLIDICFRIDLSATLVAIFILFALLSILLMHKEELLNLFWHSQNARLPSVGVSPTINAGKWVVRVSMIIFAACFTYYVANYNNRLPTPIDGAWQVNPVESPLGVLPTSIYFERNRAWMCVFRLADGSFQTHDFRVDESNKTLTISETWMTKGPVLFSGHYDLVGPTLTLTGNFAGSPQRCIIHMTRKTLRSRP
jgi:hypothetical protein